NASVTLTLAGLTVTRDTDPATAPPSGPGGSGPKVKTYVDASIAIAPDATNEVGQPHTFTVTALQNSGNGAGFVPVPDGTHPKGTVTNANGAVAQISSNTCAVPGTVNGVCSATFTSQTPGRVTGNASISLKVGGVSITRDTNPTSDAPSGPGGSGPA